MEKLVNTYCRLCAEPKSPEKLLNLREDCLKHQEILLKLTFLNAHYVEINCDNILPKTVCFICYDSLNKAYDFLDKAKRAQNTLAVLFLNKNAAKYDDLSDDDRMVFDDFLSQEPAEDLNIEVKQEKISPKLIKSASTALETVIEVKNEPKEEYPEQPNLSDILNENVTNNCEQTLDVQDIIEAAICNIPMNSNVEIYAKDLPDLDKSVIKTWKDYPWLCALCNIEFLDLDTLRLHAKAVHGKCATFLCIDCKVARKDKFTSFVKHVRKHWKSLRNYCYYCNEIIDKTESSGTHLKLHFLKSQLPCPLCGEIVQNEEELKLHLQEYGAVKTKRKPRRKPGTPITVEDLTCSLCKKVYKNPNSLRDHMKLHKIDRKRNYTCERCGKMFYNKGTLTSHIMSHDKIRPHVCRICNKSFLYPNMLRRHVEMHSGVKPFSCEQCGRCFRLQYQLNAHKIVHTNSMPHICQYCNKAFRYKQILKNHERQHTGAKPYSCQQCGMEFTNWSNYNKHMKRRHNTDTSKKKITPEGVFPINSETGQIIRVENSLGMEEWKSKIMIPAKRGKKRVIKQENND
ncbi:gastrula zinc finger protein XlCGF26.1-like [Amyelois transitella]|uniref:gastrula zinc finger protein XlCGF26.1-like n=1 Tax=Amyelois transitella TaxID=680683 RepID=UPI00298F8685|nr:gastrula zinc finger protein XlCGF26.1-like [Amyelois transitella]